MRLGLPVDGVRERALGVVGITAQPAAADMETLVLKPLAIEQGLALEGVVAEAAALLRYMLRQRASAATLCRFVAGWRRMNFGAPVMSPLLRGFPWLLRLGKPPPGDRRSRAVGFRACLAAAAMLSETEAAYDDLFYAYRLGGAGGMDCHGRERRNRGVPLAGVQSNLDNNGQRRAYRHGPGRDCGTINWSDTKATHRDVIFT